MKVLLWVVLFALTILLGAAVWFYFNSSALLKRAIESSGSEAIGAPLRVGDVVMEWEKGRGELRRVTVGQPAGFGTGSLLLVERVSIGVPLDANNGRDGVFHLTEVSISGATLNVIAKGESTNLAAMKAQVDQQVASSQSPVADVERQPAETRPIRLIIDHLEFTNLQTHVNSDVLGELDLKVPDISENNLGGDVGGLTVDQLAYAILKPLSRRVTRELIKEGLDEDRLKDELKARARDKLDSELKKLTERLQSRD
jgi:hypothetical protein